MSVSRLCLVSVSLFVCGCSSLHRVDKVDKIDPNSPNTVVGEGVVYALPQSELVATVPLTATLKTVGRFAHLAGPLLGEKAPLVASKTVKLGSLELATVARADPEQVYVVRMTKSRPFEAKSLSLALSRYGLLTDATSESENQAVDFVVATAVTGLGVAAKDKLLSSVELPIQEKKFLGKAVRESEATLNLANEDTSPLVAGNLLRGIRDLPHVLCPLRINDEKLWPEDLWKQPFGTAERDGKVWAYLPTSIVARLSTWEDQLLPVHGDLFGALKECRTTKLEIQLSALSPDVLKEDDAQVPSEALIEAVSKRVADKLAERLSASGDATGWIDHEQTSRLFLSLQTVVASELAGRISKLEEARIALLHGPEKPLLGSDDGFSSRLKALEEEIGSLKEQFLGKSTVVKTKASFRVKGFKAEDEVLCLFLFEPQRGITPLKPGSVEGCTVLAELDSTLHPVFLSAMPAKRSRSERLVHASLELEASLAGALPAEGSLPCIDHPRKQSKKLATTARCWNGAGFRYRVPEYRTGRVRSSPPKAKLTEGFDLSGQNSRTLAVAHSLPLPQFGKTRWLPIKIGKSRKGTLGLALYEDTGAIKKLEVATEGHKTDSLSDLGTAYNAYQDAEIEVRKAEAARIEAELAKQDELAVLTREKQLLELQAAIEALTSPVPEAGVPARQIGADAEIPRVDR